MNPSSSNLHQIHDNQHHNWLGLFPFHHHVFTTSQNGGNEEDSPKLEDFLGGCGSAAAEEVSHFTVGNQTTADETDQFYDCELKTIAARFLRGFSGEEERPMEKQLAVAPPLEQPVKKAVDTFGQRTSIYRGVTRHRWTGRYEAHLWDNSCRREGQSRKGRQVYLGGYDKEDKAARAYDLAALKYWGPTTTTNFPVCNYEKELEEMKNMTRQEFVASLRRKSSGFSRGASIYRGVTRHHQHGRWQARIGRVAGNKDLYLGTFSTQEEAAEAYDIAAIKFRGLNAVTNFDMSRYDVKSIASSNLPVGGMTNKSKTSDRANSNNKSIHGSRSDDCDYSTSSSLTFVSQPSTSTLSFGLHPIKQDTSDYWSMLSCNPQNPAVNNTTRSNPVYNTSGGVLLQGTTPFSMDYPSSNGSVRDSSSSSNNNVGYFSGEINYIQQQSINGGTSSSNPCTRTVGLNNNYSNCTSYYEGGGAANYGNWMVPSLHNSIFQPAKANLSSVLQTPIFGME